MSLAKIRKTKNNLVITVPLKAERWCPFTEEVKGEMDNIIAIVDERKGYTRVGFSYRIDMSYKGKDDQWTDLFFEWFGETDEFIKMCKKLKIDIVFTAHEKDD